MKKIMIFISCILFGCGSNTTQPFGSGFTKYYINAGSHTSSPVIFYPQYGNCNINGQAYFTEKSFYDLKDEDQLDWNKFDGFKLDYNSVPNNSAMIAWKASLIDSTIEIAPYFNNYGLVLPDSNQIIKVKPYEIFSYNVRLNGDIASISITKGLITINKMRKLIRPYTPYTRVSFYFGGNEVAPNYVETFIKR